MALAFPNPSRNYDEARHGVRFSGHDGMFEISFLVEAAVLSKHQPQQTPLSEQQYLSVFDAMRSSIQEAASEMYSSHRRPTNTLTITNFR
ncbi:DUF1488 domain-containing protein [Pleomorphomonas sp. PLEO]|uniref:DUF1488 domain-containing protein n=1 Tax=Pleomorphomonas sp. PLEO TaxID=3239306 RepID=UPI00351E61A0